MPRSVTSLSQAHQGWLKFRNMVEGRCRLSVDGEWDNTADFESLVCDYTPVFILFCDPMRLFPRPHVPAIACGSGAALNATWWSDLSFSYFIPPYAALLTDRDWPDNRLACTPRKQHNLQDLQGLNNLNSDVAHRQATHFCFRNIHRSHRASWVPNLETKRISRDVGLSALVDPVNVAVFKFSFGETISITALLKQANKVSYIICRFILLNIIYRQES